MKSNKKNGVLKETTQVIFGEFKEKELKESFTKEMDEETFLNAFRFLKTYEERKEVLVNKNYNLVDDGWEKECGEDETKGDCINFYYRTFTINKVGVIEKWVKRKPFKVISHEILNKTNITLYNPYKKFTIKDDDGKSHTFYKRSDIYF